MNATETPVIQRAPLLIPALLYALGCWLGTSAKTIDKGIPGWLYSVLTLVLLLLPLLWWKGSRVLSTASLGILLVVAGCWSAWNQVVWWRSDDLRLFPAAADSPSARWQGRVDSLPEVRANYARFFWNWIRSRLMVLSRKSPAESWFASDRSQHLAR